MIPASQLRIGNYVSAFGGYQKIDDGVDLDFCSNSEDVSPIPLTIEILNNYLHKDSVSCMFKWVGNKNNVEVIYENHIFITSIKYTVSIKYLHQLQNLYYVMTGYELEINIKKLTYA